MGWSELKGMAYDLVRLSGAVGQSGIRSGWMEKWGFRRRRRKEDSRTRPLSVSSWAGWGAW